MIDCIRTRRFPTSGDPDIKYFVIKAELLSVEDGCLLRGTLNDYEAHIYLKDNAQPKYYKPRPVPYALKGRIEHELSRQVAAGILEPIEMSEWAAPIVAIEKTDQTVRICGDYKVTINLNANVDTYPIPKIEEVLANLSGGSRFRFITCVSAGFT